MHQVHNMFPLTAVILLLWSFDETSTSPLMGPADIILKFTEKCDCTVSTCVDFNVRIVQRRGGRPVMNVTANLPYKFSDKLGFDVSIAVKRNGAWKPNFLKTQGGNVCSGLKSFQKDIFERIAKELNAHQPYTCPLPAGSYSIINYYPDMSTFQAMVGNAVPYGEYRANLNMSHKADQITCQLFYVDVVPKTTKKKGR